MTVCTLLGILQVIISGVLFFLIRPHSGKDTGLSGTLGICGGGGHATEGCCDANQKPRSHDTSRIAWAKLMARVGEEFPLECPNCGGDIRLIALHPSRGRSGRSWPTWANRSNRHRCRPRAARPPTGASSCKSTFDRDIFQASPDELPAIDIHSL